MRQLPGKIADVLARKKKEYPFNVVLRKINGRYYLYKDTGIWNREKKQTFIRSEYLGKVTEEGKFIEKRARVSNNIEDAEKIILSHGGVVSWHKKDAAEEATINEQMPNEIEKQLLKVISMNSRADLLHWGRKLKIGNYVYEKIKQMEQKYDIKYFSEIDVEKLGFLKILITVKFINKVPPIAIIEKVLKKEPRIQLAMLTKGEYDVVAYALVKNVSSEEVIDLVFNLRSGPLSEYDAKWHATPFYEHSGYVLLRDEFVISLKPLMKKREYAVMKELNKNGIMDFTSIDKLYGFDAGRADSTYHSLKEKGIIKRVTISMDNPKLKYLAIIFKELLNDSKFRKHRAGSLKDIIEEGILLNKYVLTGEITNPETSLLFMPVAKEGELELELEKLESLGLGLSLKALIVTKVLFGSFAYRRFDVKYLKQYDILTENYGLKKEPKENYEETGRVRKPKKRKQEAEIELPITEDEE